MRNRFDEQLFEMNRELIEMGAMCEEAIASAVKALTTGDIELAKKVKNTSGFIDQKERDIESRCMKLLLHQQPVARDLRAISAALKMITDMERIGDHANDIAELTLAITMQPHRINMGHIKQMAKETIVMVIQALEAYVNKDIEQANAVIAMDDVVDELFLAVKKEILKILRENIEYGEQAEDLLMAAKYFERIGDHATNIAEWVIFSITGRHVDDE